MLSIAHEATEETDGAAVALSFRRFISEYTSLYLRNLYIRNLTPPQRDHQSSHPSLRHYPIRAYFASLMSYSHYNRSTNNTGYRGGGTRGTRNPSYSTSANIVSLPPDRDLMEGLRSVAIQTISKPQVNVSTSNPIKPENVKYIGSYNWEEESTPTIIVPGTCAVSHAYVPRSIIEHLRGTGSPPEWRGRPFPYRVPFDTDVRFVDQNGYRMGDASCLLPIFRAVDIIAEENADTSLDWGSVDIVTDRNGLRKLMRWLQYSPESDNNKEPPKEFRIDLQLGGKKTVLMNRWEKRTRENAEPPRSGCGMNFERESTMSTKGCERSTGHHRIVQHVSGLSHSSRQRRGETHYETFEGHGRSQDDCSLRGRCMHSRPSLRARYNNHGSRNSIAHCGRKHHLDQRGRA